MAKDNVYEKYNTDMGVENGQHAARNNEAHDQSYKEEMELELALQNALQYSEDEDAIELDAEKYADMHPFWAAGSDPHTCTGGLSGSTSSASSDQYISYCEFFISSRGNEYFCEIDEDYLTDRFNLTGLQGEVQYYQYALDLVTDVFDLDCDDEMRETIEKSARHLYGLVHARYIVTTRGLTKMLEKYKKGDFGKCPRVACDGHGLLPMGLSDNPNTKAVKLYCGKCEDVYNPKSSRHSAIDGAYFGTSFHNILHQVYPALIPAKTSERYVPRIYGFKVHASAALIRWQHAQRDDMRRRLRKLDIDSGFKDEIDELEAEESEEEEEEEVDMEGNLQVMPNPANINV